MNRYPLWKYLLILAVITVGVIYALPNIYPPDPAIQISGSSAALDIDDRTMTKAEQAIKELGVDYFGAENSGTSGLIRLYDRSMQLSVQRKVQEALGSDYVVAVNLAPTTPQWLLDLGAGPMKLGLDLAGGVHFLLEVDTARVLTEELESIEDTVEKHIRSERLHGVDARVHDGIMTITTDTDEQRMKLTDFLRKEVPELQYERVEQGGKFLLNATMSDAYIRQKEDYAVSQNLTTLRNRVNEIGVAEPMVQRQGRNRIVVELPGIQDTARAKSIIGKTANLEFRLEANETTFTSQREEFPWRDELKQSRSGNNVVEKRPVITGSMVTNAQIGYDPDTSLPQVNITLDSQGGTAMHRRTRDNVGRRMAVVFIEYKTEIKRQRSGDGEEEIVYEQIPQASIISFPVIQGALGRSFRITGIDNPAEASELALLLRAGALAAPMGFVEERTIGPSLGAENIALGVKSVQIGLALVLVFMLFYYKVFGFAANIALAVNLTLLIAIMSMFGATLTLPGIAGIVLTVGMAVDANVLIFSRIREELANGVPPQTAIKSGFERALETILDANITTFIVAIILYGIGTGSVKGFAVTLAIGIVTSVFTATTCTRAIVNLIYGGRRVNKLWI
ncbi:protein translocase subunit SecD [Teredinibacter waterburyi]|jgi:protein-export membrane protein, SecD/SecF family/protein-export membrane protein SecD|uniref:protein translocase subunit SecD n=1 Tax=Teredinibacter waterburyi TaxID=1500538 RepID=UPI00165FB72F|nr:protein translocase subunit SecD [Teredinibacter waterburyi]